MVKRVLAGLGVLVAVGGVGPAEAGGGPCPREWASGFSAAGPDDNVYALAEFDDGSGPALYVGGSFHTAGQAIAQNIARWDGSSWSPVGGGDSR